MDASSISPGRPRLSTTNRRASITAFAAWRCRRAMRAGFPTARRLARPKWSTFSAKIIEMDLSSIKSAAGKALSLARAIFSLLRHGEVTPQTYVLRQAECLDCEKRVEAGRGVYCGECKCPQWFLSDLRTKARMPGVKCPLNKW